MSLFRNEPSKKELCTSVLTPWEGFTALTWVTENGYTPDFKEKVVTYTCPDARLRRTDTATAKKISILQLPRGCKFGCNSFIMEFTKTKYIMSQPCQLQLIYCHI